MRGRRLVTASYSILKLGNREINNNPEPDIILKEENLEMYVGEDFPDLKKSIEGKKGVSDVAIDFSLVENMSPGTYPVVITYKKNKREYRRREQFTVLPNKSQEIEQAKIDSSTKDNAPSSVPVMQPNDLTIVQTGDEGVLVLLIMTFIISFAISLKEGLRLIKFHKNRKNRI